MKCLNCNNIVPENVTLCPYCGSKITTEINITEETTLNNKPVEQIEQITKEEETSKKTNVRTSEWFNYSTELIKNNIVNIIIIGVLNNPFFLILSLLLVSAWYNSFLYRICIAFKGGKTNIHFDYSKGFLEGIVIMLINTIVTLPFFIVLLIIGSFLIYILFNSKNIPAYEAIFLINYIIFILYLIFCINLSMILKYFTLLALSDYKPEEKWNTVEILKKVFHLLKNNWLISLILFFIFMVINFAIQNVIGILCYCTIGVIFLFSTIPYIIVDIFIIIYLMGEYLDNKMKK
ncbi:MAG: hypothetical protein N2169_05265 [bacterium]|nr:hypothetical protein [bacterium]